MKLFQSLTHLLNSVIRFGCRHPRQLFLVDGAGAFLSALMLGVVLIRLESYFGIPPRMLLILAAFPVLFVVYDLCCVMFHPRSPGLFLRIIGFANLCYVFICFFLIIDHSGSILRPGWIYLVSEMLIVAAIGFGELCVSWQLATGPRGGERHP